MKILIDECVDQRLRFLFSGHDCETAAYAKLSGLKNGALLAAAEAADFEAIVTTDQEIPYQQNLALRKISVIVLCAPTKRLADLQPLGPAVIEAPGSIKPGQVVRIPRKNSGHLVPGCIVDRSLRGFLYTASGTV